MMRMDDARRAGFACAEGFGMDVRARKAPVCEVRIQRVHERSRAAQVELCFTWNLQRVEACYRQMTGGIEIRAEPILGCRSAVPDSTPDMWQEAQECAGLQRKRVVLAVASGVKPPDLARRTLGGQRVQYRQHWRDADAGARQHERTLVGFEREGASRRAHLQHVANADLAV